jgi:hypothetical protein
MTELRIKDKVFKSELFSPIPLGDEGEAGDSLPITEVVIDEELHYPDWPTEQGARRLGRHILGSDTENLEALASYGYTVYRDLLKEEVAVEAVYLDPRCFLSETDLLDVLEQAAKCALDDNEHELVKPIVTGMIHTAQGANFGGDRMRKYLDTVISSGDLDAIRVYVEFMNKNTTKTSESSKVFLKRMAHMLQAIPDDSDYTDRVDQLNKMTLLQDIAYAWIQKRMPSAEIDWLP